MSKQRLADHNTQIVLLTIGVAAFLTKLFHMYVMLKRRLPSKNYLFITGYVVATLIASIGYMSSSGRRLRVLNGNIIASTKLECFMYAFHLSAFPFSDVLTTMCLFWLAMEHMLAACFPDLYAKLTSAVLKVLTAMSIVVSLAITMFSWIYMLQTRDQHVSASCKLHECTAPWIYTVVYIVPLFFIIMAMILHVATAVFVKLIQRQNSMLYAELLHHVQRVSYIITTIFVTFMAERLIQLLHVPDAYREVVATMLWTFSGLNLSIQSVVYIYAYPDLRAEARKVFNACRCKFKW
uniref:G_PROTEIN_RECEP_F1_2 domain-containing protein n=1 Tax=Trichuris muris TaxID=70415 RepID=A0A5S6QAC5_TRIMR